MKRNCNPATAAWKITKFHQISRGIGELSSAQTPNEMTRIPKSQRRKRLSSGLPSRNDFILLVKLRISRHPRCNLSCQRQLLVPQIKHTTAGRIARPSCEKSSTPVLRKTYLSSKCVKKDANLSWIDLPISDTMVPLQPVGNAESPARPHQGYPPHPACSAGPSAAVICGVVSEMSSECCTDHDGSAAQCPVLGGPDTDEKKEIYSIFVLGSCSTASKYGFIEYYSNRTRLYGNVRKTSNSFHRKLSVKASVSLHHCCAVSRIPLFKSSATSATLSSSQGVFLPEVFRAGSAGCIAQGLVSSAGYHWTVGNFGKFCQPRDSRVTLSASQSWRSTTAGPLWTETGVNSESIRHDQTWWIVKHHQLISIITI